MLLKHTHIRTEPVLISIRSATIHSRARGSRDDNDSLAGLIVTFFSGICLEQNLGPDRARITKKIDAFMRLIRAI